MRTRILSLLFVAAGAAMAADGPPPASDGAVATVPLSDVLAWVRNAEAKPEPKPAPPMPFALLDARWRFRLGQPEPAAEAELQIEVFAEGWNAVPLVKTSLPLKSQPPEAAIVSRDGELCLLAEKPGRYSVPLAFDIAPSDAAPGAEPLELCLPPAASGVVEIVSAPAGARAVASIEGASRSGGRISLPPGGGELRIRVVADSPSAPTAWNADTQAVVFQRADRLEVDSRIRLRGSEGNGLAAELDMPASAENVAVSGEDLAPWRSGNSLRWETPGVLTREVAVHYELPLPDGAKSWNVRLPEVKGGGAGTFRAIVVPDERTRLGGADGRIVSDAAAWPRFAAKDASDEPVFLAGRAAFTVDAAPIPRLEVDPTRIPSAKVETRIVPDGALLSGASFTVRHRGAMRWRFSLPEGAKLLSCEVDGRPVDPFVGDGGSLEVRFGAGDGADRQSEVRIAFTGRLDRIAPIEGRLALSAPHTETFIDELRWDISLPDGYEATAFDGNVEPAGKGAGMAFQKGLIRGETPRVEIYYRKKAETN